MSVRCNCGSVELELVGKPIVSTVCYCHSCQEAGRQIERMAHAPRVLQDDGGTPYVLYRKDRIVCTHGADLLRDRLLKPDSKTRRVVASCCNAPMFLELSNGHWQTFYRDRFPHGAPAIEMRVMTSDKPDGVRLADDLPNYAGHSGRFFWRLFAAWVAMGFRTDAR